MHPKRLANLRLTNFKAFERFEPRLPAGVVCLVGPNNAGKSTLLAAARSAARMVRVAQCLKADDQRQIEGVLQYGHTFAGEQIGLIEENLRHEFVQEDTRLEARFGRDARLVAWPIDEDNGGFFLRTYGSVTSLRATCWMRTRSVVSRARPLTGS